MSDKTGMGQRASTGLNLFNSFWAYVMPMVGAWVADTYLGRFKTIQWSILLALIGHLLLTVAALPAVLSQGKAIGCFIVAIIMMGMGTGGFKANISPLIAEQYQEKMHIKVLPSGERVIVDPIITVSRIYMYFYLMINVGALIGQVGMVVSELCSESGTVTDKVVLREVRWLLSFFPTSDSLVHHMSNRHARLSKEVPSISTPRLPYPGCCSRHKVGYERTLASQPDNDCETYEK